VKFVKITSATTVDREAFWSVDASLGQPVNLANQATFVKAVENVFAWTAPKPLEIAKIVAIFSGTIAGGCHHVKYALFRLVSIAAL
jgi:hypothetical protein